MNTGEIVRAARESREITVKQLSDMTGLSLQTIYGIEEGKTSPKMDTMLLIMRALEYDIIFNPRYKGGYIDE